MLASNGTLIETEGHIKTVVYREWLSALSSSERRVFNQFAESYAELSEANRVLNAELESTQARSRRNFDRIQELAAELSEN